MATLYDHLSQYKLLKQFIEDNDQEGFELALSQIEGNISDKLEGYAKVIKEIESDVNGLDGEIKRLQGRKESAVKSITRMKERMTEALLAVEPDENGKHRLKTDKFTFSFKPSTVCEVDVDRVPKKYLKPKFEVDKATIKKLLQEGQKVPGARLVENKSLQIK